MRLLVSARYMLTLHGILILVLFQEGHFVRIEKYSNICNETITLSDANNAGILLYTYTPDLDSERCKIVIETAPDHQVGYMFKETSAFRTISIQNDRIYYACTTIVWYENGVERNYGCINNNHTQKIQTTVRNTLTIDIQGDGQQHFNFELILFSVHYGTCNSYEMPCYLLEANHEERTTVCIGSYLAYDRTLHVCHEQTDIVIDGPSNNGALIAAIVILSIIFLPLLILSGCVIFRKYCKKPEPEPEDIPTRARRLFAAIMAEAHENTGYDTGSIDPSKFDPPPEYGSLEHLDGTGLNESDGQNDSRLSHVLIECPPSYGDVMKNSHEYLVSSHI